MIKVLKSNNPVNFILMFVIMLALWSFKFIYMPQPTESYEHYSYIFPELGESRMFQYISAVVALLVYYAFAFFIIKTNLDLSIVESAYQSPGIFYVIITGLYVNVQRILPEIFASMLLYMSVVSIFYSYKKFKAYGNCFDAGLLFGLSILLVYKFVIFLPLLIIALIIIRPFTLKELISLIMGIFCPLVIAGSIIYLYFDFSELLSTIYDTFSEYHIRINKYNLYIFLPVLILSVIAIISKFVLNVSQNIFTRKAQNILIFYLFFAIIYFISPFANNEQVIVFFAPLSLLLSYIFVNTGRISGIILFWGVLLCMFFLQIIQFKIIY
ncbi:MAG: DUF6427 family protein [Bacteroidales bacterium]|jgi:hypothetical protein|nr:DUF6427 family protein [Bacteroidales bacterium]